MTEAENVPAPAPEAPAAETPAVDPKQEVIVARRQALHERIEATKHARESAARHKKSEEDFTSRLKELETREASLKAEETRWKDAYKDPVKAFSEMGIRPESLFQRLYDTFVDADAPEAKQRRQVEELRREIDSARRNPDLDSFKKELAEVKAQLAEREKVTQEREQAAYQAEKSRREQIMLNHLQDEQYQELLDYYDNDSLIKAAYFVTEKLRKEGENTDFDAIAKKMLALHQDWLYDIDKKKKSRQPKTSPEPAKASKPVSESESTKRTPHIGNAVAAEVASGRDKTKEERAASRRQYLDSELGKYRDA